MVQALLAGVLAGCLMGFVLAWLWHRRAGVLAEINALELMAAIGTVGATIAAVWLGLREQKWRREEMAEQQNLGLLYASAMDSRLKSLIFLLSRESKDVARYPASSYDTAHGRQILQDAIEELWSIDIQKFSVASRLAAAELMAAIDHLYAARDIFFGRIRTPVGAIESSRRMTEAVCALGAARAELGFTEDLPDHDF